jgi:opacity protein-like surface antigen
MDPVCRPRGGPSGFTGTRLLEYRLIVPEEERGVAVFNWKWMPVIVGAAILAASPVKGDIGREVMKTSERAVGDAIGSILAETIETSEAMGSRDSRSVWLRPVFARTTFEIDTWEGEGELTVDALQLLGGYLHQVDRFYLGVTGGYSWVDVDAELRMDDGDEDGFDARAHMISFGPTVTGVFYRGERLSGWTTLQASWYRMGVDDLSFDDPGDTDDMEVEDTDIYDGSLAAYFLYQFTDSFSLLAGGGASVVDVDVEGAEAAWRCSATIGGRYNTGPLKLKLTVKADYSLENDETLVLETGPDLDWSVSDAFTLGVGYRYGYVVDANFVEDDGSGRDIDIDIYVHTVNLSLRYEF